MTNNSLYRVCTEYVEYLVLAPDQETAIQALWETEGSTEEEWRADNDDITVGIVSPDKWDAVFMHEDEDDGPFKPISAVVAATKLAPGAAEVIAHKEY